MVPWRKVSQTGNCPPISANHVYDRWGYNCVLPNSKSHFLHFSSTMFHCDFSNLLSCYPLVIYITYLWKVAHAHVTSLLKWVICHRYVSEAVRSEVSVGPKNYHLVVKHGPMLAKSQQGFPSQPCLMTPEGNQSIVGICMYLWMISPIRSPNIIKYPQSYIYLYVYIYIIYPQYHHEHSSHLQGVFVRHVLTSLMWLVTRVCRQGCVSSGSTKPWS